MKRKIGALICVAVLLWGCNAGRDEGKKTIYHPEQDQYISLGMDYSDIWSIWTPLPFNVEGEEQDVYTSQLCTYLTAYIFGASIAIQEDAAGEILLNQNQGAGWVLNGDISIGASRDAVLSSFGEPTEEMPDEGVVIYVYNDGGETYSVVFTFEEEVLTEIYLRYGDYVTVLQDRADEVAARCVDTVPANAA